MVNIRQFRVSCTFLYDPFGMILAERNWISGSENYRYGFNTQEGDDDIYGKNAAYSTFYRGLDPRIGRWLSVDPKTIKTPWESPYVTNGNNPICNYDIYGDEFDKHSLKKAHRFEKKATKKLASIESEIGKMEASVGTNPTPTQQLDLQNLNDIKIELEQSLEEMFEMGLSELVTYSIRSSIFLPGDEEGRTYYDSKKDKVVIKSNLKIGTRAHELKHGFQYLNGELSFAPTQAGDRYWNSGLLHDQTDESNAYRRQYAFQPDVFIAAGINYMSLLQPGVYPATYPAGRTQSLTINSSISIVEMVTGAQFTLIGLDKSQTIISLFYYDDKHGDQIHDKTINSH